MDRSASRHDVSATSSPIQATNDKRAPKQKGRNLATARRGKPDLIQKSSLIFLLNFSPSAKIVPSSATMVLPAKRKASARARRSSNAATGAPASSNGTAAAGTGSPPAAAAASPARRSSPRRKRTRRTTAEARAAGAAAAAGAAPAASEERAGQDTAAGIPARLGSATAASAGARNSPARRPNGTSSRPPTEHVSPTSLLAAAVSPNRIYGRSRTAGSPASLSATARSARAAAVAAAAAASSSPVDGFAALSARRLAASQRAASSRPARQRMRQRLYNERLEEIDAMSSREAVEACLEQARHDIREYPGVLMPAIAVRDELEEYLADEDNDIPQDVVDRSRSQLRMRAQIDASFSDNDDSDDDDSDSDDEEGDEVFGARYGNGREPEQDYGSTSLDRAEFESFQRQVTRDAAEGGFPAAVHLAGLLEQVDPDNIPPAVMRAIRDYDSDNVGGSKKDDVSENESDEEDNNSDAESMPPLESAQKGTAESPPCSPSRLINCAICLETFRPSRLVTLPCCAESESTSSTRFCPGCIAGLAHHEMISYHVSNAEMADNFHKSSCAVGECPRCKKLIAVTNRKPPSFFNFTDNGADFEQSEEMIWSVDGIGLRLADMEMSVEFACRYAWRTNYGLQNFMDLLGFLSYLPFPGQILKQTLEYVHDSPSEARRMTTRLVQWGLLKQVGLNAFCLSDEQQAELREGRYRQLMSHPSGSLRPLGYKYFSHYAKFVPWTIEVDDMSNTAIRSFLTFWEGFANCMMVTGYLLLTLPIPLLEFKIVQFIRVLRQTVLASAMCMGVVPGRFGPVSIPQQILVSVVMTVILYLLWNIIKTIVWSCFVGYIAISLSRSLYSLKAMSRNGTAAMFLLLHMYSHRESSLAFGLNLLLWWSFFKTLSLPRKFLSLYFFQMLLGNEGVRLLLLRSLTGGSPYIGAAAAH